MVLILVRKSWVPVLGVPIAAAIWRYLPALWLGWDRFQDFLSHQTRSLGDFISTSYSHYDNFFKFLDSIHCPITFKQTLILSGGVGLSFFVRMIYGVFKKEPIKIQVTRALMLGSVFIMTLSPMAQNNASIFLVPVFCFALMMRRSPKSAFWKQRLILGFLVFLSFAYSDLVPHAARDFLREYSLKSVFTLIFAFGSFFETPEVSDAKLT